jgi:hypothetical protein
VQETATRLAATVSFQLPQNAYPQPRSAGVGITLYSAAGAYQQGSILLQHTRLTSGADLCVHAAPAIRSQ